MGSKRLKRGLLILGRLSSLIGARRAAGRGLSTHREASDTGGDVAPARDAGHMPALDALRAVAALLVFAYHLGRYGVSFGPFQWVATGGHVGVTIFFVLSGYLLFEPFVRGPVNVRSYLTRRVLRIMPAYVFALIGLSLVTGDPSFPSAPLTYLLLLQNYDPNLFQKFLGTAWTLQLELTFYLLLPLIAVAMVRLWRRDVGRPGFILCAAAIVSLFGGFAVLTSVAGPAGVQVAALFPFMFWAFVPGMLLALVAVRRPDALRELGRWPLVICGFVLLILGVWANVGYGNLVVATGTFLVVAGALVHRPSGRTLGVFALAGGTLSYPFYLWQWDLTGWFWNRGFTGAGLAIVVLLVAGGVSAVSYLVLERPAIRLGRRLSARTRPARLGSADADRHAAGRVPVGDGA